jgi:hypothetical protein
VMEVFSLLGKQNGRRRRACLAASGANCGGAIESVEGEIGCEEGT